ncbi:MAG: dihydropteridine reductase [Clostridia bacterium]|nr:dihydropteridine reductase [Clostridia bacterium]
MENRNDQKFIAQQIRAQYTEKQHTQLDALRALDKKEKKPANIFAYVFGCITAIIMGSGMSLVMTDIGEAIGIADPMAPGIVIGIIGMLMAIINYPIYKKLLASRRKKYSAEIMKLSDDILNK